MIVYIDPDTGYQAKCSLSSSVPEGVPYKEVPAHIRDEFNEAITGYDINDLPVFDVVKTDKIKTIAEGVRRISLLFPTIQSLDDINFFSELWKSIAPAARVATVEFQEVIDVYTAAKTAIANETSYDTIVWP